MSPGKAVFAAVFATLMTSTLLTAPATAQERALRVCADPNNLPFSNRAEEGFENRIAEIVADAMDARVEYTWWPLRRGFIRNTLRERKCDVVMGVPTTYELVLATEPYYRSTYVFLYPKNAGFEVSSLEDSVLRRLKIGVHTIGDDYANSPPAHALGARDIVDNVVGYSVYGDYDEPNPPAEIVRAVAEGEVDMAIVWGPIAGYFSRQHPVEFEMVPVSPQIDMPFLPFVYDMSMGVRRCRQTQRPADLGEPGTDPQSPTCADEELRDELNTIIESKSEEIRAVLDEYGVPIVERARRRR